MLIHVHTPLLSALELNSTKLYVCKMFRVNFSHMESAFPSSIRTSAHAPAQTGEEQSNYCYLDEGFTRRVLFARNPRLKRL